MEKRMNNRHHDHALEAAISHLANQPDVSVVQVQQLRAALSADRVLHEAMRSAAALGVLRGFEVQRLSDSAIPAGLYERSSGVVSLPPVSFALSGHMPTDDLHAVLRVQAMVVSLGTKSYIDNAETVYAVSSDMLTNLQATLNGSPVLADEIKRAVMVTDASDRRILSSFEILPPDSGMGGSYSAADRAMNLPAKALDGKSKVSGFDPYELTFVMGHEVQHCLSASETADARKIFDRTARDMAAMRVSVHDYTQAIGTYIQSGREDEAKAEIAGWNALHSRAKQKNADVTLKDMYQISPIRVADFVDRVALDGKPAIRSNLHLNADLSIPYTPENIAAMGENYFNRPPKAHLSPGDPRTPMMLGPHLEGDYPNHYAKWAIGTAVWAEQGSRKVHGHKPELAIDMERLGLYEDTIERSGLNLGASAPSVRYIDRSHGENTERRFDHTFNGPNANEHVPIVSPEPSRLHRELRDAFPAGVSEDRLAQIALAAKEGGIEAGRMRSMDIRGENLLMTGMTPGTHAVVDLSTAPPPAEQSNQQFQVAVEQQALQQQMSQQHSGPTMSLGR
jgi:hypothetical protein